jgi:drug/metabolite transporter (DMT)-like permease
VSILVLITLTSVQILFGLNFVFSKIVVNELSPLAFAFWRFLLAGIVLTVFAVLKSNGFPKLERQDWKRLLLLGLTGVSLSQGLFLTGLSHTTSTNTSLLSTTIPLFTILISCFRGQTRLNALKVLGFTLAFAGVLFGKDLSQMSFANSSFKGDLMVVGGCFFLGHLISYSKDLVQRVSPSWATALIFLFGSIFLAPFCLDELMSLASLEADPRFWGSFAFCVIGGTLLTYFLNNWVIQFTKPDIVGLFIYLQPIVTAFCASALLGETLKARIFISAFLIVLGVLFASKIDKKTQSC